MVMYRSGPTPLLARNGSNSALHLEAVGFSVLTRNGKSQPIWQEISIKIQFNSIQFIQ